MKRKLKFIVFSLFLCFCVTSCNNEEEFSESTPVKEVVNKADIKRLKFNNENEILQAITSNGSLKSLIQNEEFISMNEPVMNAPHVLEFLQFPAEYGSFPESVIDETLPFYEVLGFDTLVPNVQLAGLFNPLGELEIGNKIVKITPQGTFEIPIEKMDYFNNIYKLQNGHISGGTPIGEQSVDLGNGILLYKTFEENPENYIVEHFENYQLNSDEIYPPFQEDEGMGSLIPITKADTEPNYDSFQTYSPNRKTFVGKFIQSIIGTTKTHTIDFSSKRRVRGQFYAYNYGFYSETGVSGWTDKKNLIGWSKTASSELRVGWRSVVVKRSIPKYMQQSLKEVNNLVYYPPVYVDYADGKRLNTATLIVPEYKAKYWWEKVASKGLPEAIKLAKSELGSQGISLENAEALVLSSPTELLFLPADRIMKKYNTKSYTHTFIEHYSSWTVGWNNQKGFIINGVMTADNINKAGTWLNLVGKAFNESKPTLTAGETFVCAKFGNDWRGMKITCPK